MINRIVLICFIITISLGLYADETAGYIDGNVIIQTSEIITVTQTQPSLVTSNKWFNALIPQIKISNLNYLGEFLPAQNHEDYMFYMVEFDETISVDYAIADFEKCAEVITARPNHIITLDGINTNDTYSSDMWNLEKIGMDAVWNQLNVYGDANITIAVVDTGIDLGADLVANPTINIHPDLQDNLWTNIAEFNGTAGVDDDYNGVMDDVYGWNPFADEVFGDDELETIPQDFYGHGTHVAGIIGARPNNSAGVAGIAGGWTETGNNHAGCKVMALRYGGTRTDKIFSEQAAIRGLYYAYVNDADIINMSWHMPDTPALANCINIIANSGINSAPILVAASGNASMSTGWHTSFYPAGYTDVIAIGATGADDYHASYTQINGPDYVQVCAPGGAGSSAIYSTTPQDQLFYKYVNNNTSNNYGQMMGTSMAAPLAAGLLGLLKSEFPTYTNDELVARMLGTADDIYHMHEDHFFGQYGSGRINAYRALTESEHPTLRLAELIIDDNGVFEAGEDIDMQINLKNWWIDGTNITGDLTTTDPKITITNGTGMSFGNIAKNAIGFNTTQFDIFDDPDFGYPRNVTFTLTLHISSYADQTIEFTIPISSNVTNPFAVIGNPNNESITSEMTISNIDDIGTDELIVCSSNSMPTPQGFVNIYKNSSWITYICDDSLKADPVTADLDGDGIKEIIVGDKSGTIYVLDSNGLLLDDTQDTNSEITSIVAEDLNADGNLEIICGGNIYSQNGDVDYKITWISDILGTPVVNYYSRSNEFVSNIAVGNINDYITSPEKEISYLVKDFDTNGFITGLSLHTIRWITDLSRGGEITEHSEVDVWAPGDRLVDLRVSNLLLLKPNVDEFYTSYGFVDFYQNLAYFVVESYEENTIQPTPDSITHHNKMRCMRLETDTNSQDYDKYVDVWTRSLPQIWGTNFDQDCKIIPGEFDDDPGKEILVSMSENIVDPEGQLPPAGNPIVLDQITEYEIPRRYETELIVDVNNNNVNDVVVTKASSLKFYDENQREIEYLNMKFDYSFDSRIYSTAVGNFNSQNYLTLIVLLKNGELYVNDLNSTSIAEWDQNNGNDRRTGSYYQPIPTTIDFEFELNHDAIIKKDIAVKEGSLIVNKGNEIRFEADKTINNFDGYLEMNGTANDPIIVSGLCNSDLDDYWLGMNFYSKSSSEISRSDISNAKVAVNYVETVKHLFDLNSVHNNKTGFRSYDSFFDINANAIYNNFTGMQNYHNSAIHLCNSTSGSGYNLISDNSNGVYVNASAPDLTGYNDILNNTNYNVSVLNQRNVVIAEKNWWGSTSTASIESTLSPASLVDYTPFETSANRGAGRSDSISVYQEGYEFMILGDYSNAITNFKAILEDPVETSEDFMAISSLYSCYFFLSDTSEYKTYISNLLVGATVDMQPVIKNFIALADRSLGNYSDAIAYYESVIENEPSYEDSCYAVIDIGNTYLESEGRASGRMTHLIPESEKTHQLVSETLLESIRTGEHISNENVPVPSAVLYNNYPNPFNPTTNISFALPTDSDVKLEIYNVKGQKVKTLAKERMDSGMHNIVWNGKDNNDNMTASGVYFYKLSVNGKSKDIKKMLLLK